MWISPRCVNCAVVRRESNYWWPVGNNLPFFCQCTDTHLSQKVISLILSFLSPWTVFICSFMVAAPIFGYLGDRFNRKAILSCGIFFWSTVTLLSSFISKEVRRTMGSTCSSVSQTSSLTWMRFLLKPGKWNDTPVERNSRFCHRCLRIFDIFALHPINKADA